MAAIHSFKSPQFFNLTIRIRNGYSPPVSVIISLTYSFEYHMR
jgi:hypothetical protein